MSAFLSLQSLKKTYPDGTIAVRGLDLEIEEGEFIVLLGPSGCGKTTTLRMVAGLEKPSSGRILMGDRDVTEQRPSGRDIGFVFQFYALYPHMTVLENLLFPLRNSGLDPQASLEKARQTAEKIGILSLLDAHPGQLSGGDQQRVGLARAMVRRPALYLMDEPLGTLDAGLRAETRDFIRKRQLEDHVTTIYVTHDQEEAMALADRIVVMEGGLLRQVASPAEVYDRPADLFTARFVGSPGMNFLNSATSGGPETIDPRLKTEVIGIRPEFVRLDPRGNIRGRVVQDSSYGGYRLLHLETDQGRLVARTGPRPGLAPGKEVRLSLEPAGLRRFDEKSGRAL